MISLDAFYVLLSNIKDFNINTARRILSNYGSLAGFQSSSFDELVHAGFPVKVAEDLVFFDISLVDKELSRLNSFGGYVVSYENPSYPKLLKDIQDPPLLLYAKGDISCLNNLSIALVGARKVSRQGEDFSHKLAYDLSLNGVTVVSGLAYGVDINAHKGALDANGSTVAVLGSGFANIYPKQHKGILDKICEKGCVLTQFNMDEIPNAYNFPKRNRIVSGISKATVVVESSLRSGSLITSRLSREQGRDVFAVPASPYSSNSATNNLIKEGAFLVQDFNDIVSHYGLTASDWESCVTPIFDNEEQEKIWENLSIEPMGVDELVQCSGLDYGSVVIHLMTMELNNTVLRGDDSRYYAKH